MTRRATIYAVLALAIAMGLGGFIVVSIVNGKLDTSNRRQTDALARSFVKSNRRLIIANRRVLLRECKRDNKLRSALSLDKKKQIARTKHTDPSLFPDIPLERFHRLVRKSVRQQRESLGDVSPAPCNKRIRPTLRAAGGPHLSFR